MLSVFIVLAYSTALLMRLENNRRNKKAMTNPAYTAGAQNLDEMSGLRYETLRPFSPNFSRKLSFAYFWKNSNRDQTDIQNKHFRYSG